MKREWISSMAAMAVIVAFFPGTVGAAALDSAELWKAKCSMCHGADGNGDTMMGKKLNLRPMGSAEVQKQTDAELYKWTADGKQKMPSYKAKLSKGEIDALVTHIRTLAAPSSVQTENTAQAENPPTTASGFVNALPSGSFSFEGKVPTLRIQTTKGQTGVAEVTLASDHPAFKPGDVTTKQFLSGGKSYLRATLAPDQEPTRWKLILTSEPGTPAGPLYGEVVVKTQIPEQPEFRMMVTGVVMLPGQVPAAGAMTNDEVVKLVAAELGDEIVIAKIKNAPVARLDVSTDALLSLKEEKVSKTVITAVIERAAQPDKTSAASPSSPSASAAPEPTGPCEGVELLGLHKEDFRPVSPLILYFAKIRNGTSMTKIVSVEWTNLYGERIRNTADVGAGQIATLQLAAQQPIERMPIDLRLGTCR